MYAIEKNNHIRIGIQDGYLGLRPDFLAARVEKADFSALTPEKADKEETRLSTKANALIESVSKSAEKALDAIAELQAIAGYREFLAMKRNMEEISTHNEMVIEDENSSIRQEYGRTANMVYEFSFWIDKYDSRKGDKPYEVVLV